MKLVHAAPGATLVSKIHVRDSRGNVWEVMPSDIVKRRTRYSDYQGPDIWADALSVTTPDDAKEVLVVPPLNEWKARKTYDGALSGSLVWA